MTKPILDRAEVVLECPDDLYIDDTSKMTAEDAVLLQRSARAATEAAHTFNSASKATPAFLARRSGKWHVTSMR
jgi:hypothetical protein